MLLVLISSTHVQTECFVVTTAEWIDRQHNTITYNDSIQQDSSEILKKDHVMQLIGSLQNAPKISPNIAEYRLTS